MDIDARVLAREIRRERWRWPWRLGVGTVFGAGSLALFIIPASVRSWFFPYGVLGALSIAGIAYGFGYALGGSLNRIGAVDDGSVRGFVLAYWWFERTGRWDFGMNDELNRQQVEWLRRLAAGCGDPQIARTASAALASIGEQT